MDGLRPSEWVAHGCTAEAMGWRSRKGRHVQWALRREGPPPKLSDQEVTLVVVWSWHVQATHLVLRAAFECWGLAVPSPAPREFCVYTIIAPWTW